jgi:hypothetical protein
MISVEHSIKFVTEFDETHPVSKQFLAISKEAQVEMLEGMLKELVLPAIYPVINNINEGGSYAILKVVK